MKGAAAMDRNMVYAGVSVVLAGLLGFSWAQGRGALVADEPRPLAQEIAVVDMVKVFENHKGFQKKNEEFKQEGLKVQEKIKQFQEQGLKLQEDLNKQKTGSAEFIRIKGELKAKQLEFQKFQKEQTEKFQKEQADVITTTYQQIVEQIQRIAEDKGLKLVLRTQAENLDSKNPQKLMEAVNRQVLYQNGLDITDDVVQAVN